MCCAAIPEYPGPIDWGEVYRQSLHCSSARNAGRRRRCREESRRLHPYRFTDSDDEDFTVTADEWLHRTYAGTYYCPCHSCVTAYYAAKIERTRNCQCDSCVEIRLSAENDIHSLT